MEHDGRLQDHNHRLGEVESKTSFIGNIVYGIILGPTLHHASCYVPKYIVILPLCIKHNMKVRTHKV